MKYSLVCVAGTDYCRCRDCQADYAAERRADAACRCGWCGACATQGPRPGIVAPLG